MAERVGLFPNCTESKGFWQRTGRQVRFRYPERYIERYILASRRFRPLPMPASNTATWSILVPFLLRPVALLDCPELQ